MRLSHFSVTLLNDEVRSVIFHLLINDVPICSQSWRWFSKKSWLFTRT